MAEVIWVKKKRKRFPGPGRGKTKQNKTYLKNLTKARKAATQEDGGHCKDNLGEAVRSSYLETALRTLFGLYPNNNARH